MVGINGNQSWNEKLNKLGVLGDEFEHNNQYLYLGYDTKFCSKVAYISVGMIIILVASLVLAPILINHFHYLDCGETLKASDYEGEDCSFSLVESVPENLSYPSDQPIQPSIFQSWLEMVKGAEKSIDIISFYWTMLASDVVEDPSAVQGETIFSELLKALKRGVVVTIVTCDTKPSSSPPNDTDILKQAGAKVYPLDMKMFKLSGGVLHTKMWMVDERQVYVGSANMDWRSLTQNKETGMVIKSCSLFAQDASKIIATYKYLAEKKSLPRHWPCKFKTHSNLQHPLKLTINGLPSTVVLASSPDVFCPPQRSSDLSSILHIIDEAKQFIYVSVMDYAVSNLFSRTKRYWPIIDNALRRAALDRKVEVRLMTSLWKNSKSSMFHYLKSLAALNNTWKGVSISVRLFCVPSFSQAQYRIPFSRVNHDKYMLTEQVAYLTTSNWSEDYFSDTAGVSLLINQTSPSLNSPMPSLPPPSPPSLPSKQPIQQQLKGIFERDWFSVYSFDISLYNPSKAFNLCNSTGQH